MKINSISLSVATIIDTDQGDFLRLRKEGKKYYFGLIDNSWVFLADPDIIYNIELNEEMFERKKYK